MRESLALSDRLRIERAVWSLDSRLQDLPRRSRVAKRRELRDNLRAAAEDVGAAEAVRRLGSLRKLAAEYLAAEYVDWEPRPSWGGGLTAFALVYLGLTWLLDVGSAAYRSGVTEVDAAATGTFTWHGVPLLLDAVRFEFVDGTSTSVGGAFTPLAYLLMVVAVVAAGRLWRFLPAWRRHGTD